MNWFYKLLYLLQEEMNTPVSFGWFHFLWILLTIISIFILYKLRNKYNEKQLKIVLGLYGVIAFLLEVLKQLIWSFNYDPLTNIITWDYEWYAFPFQLCTTPIYVSLICLFLKKNKLRTSLLSYISFVTILGSFMTIIIPDSCFTSDILVNIHTMYLHCGSFVVSIFLLMNEVEINKKNLKNGIIVFLIFLLIAQALNILIYNIGILNKESFNMFYISPYFISSLPVFDVLQENLPYVIYLLIYIIIISIGASAIYGISLLIKKINNYIKNKE